MSLQLDEARRVRILGYFREMEGCERQRSTAAAVHRAVIADLTKEAEEAIERARMVALAGGDPGCHLLLRAELWLYLKIIGLSYRSGIGSRDLRMRLQASFSLKLIEG